MGSTATDIARRGLLAAGLAGLAGCVGMEPMRPVGAPGPIRDGVFQMKDGAVLPYRSWLPDRAAESVVLALHGFADSRDAWELPAPVFAAAGVALYGPDQRGFGQTAERGRWAGAERMTEDADAMLGSLRARHPGRKIFVLGVSMGGAVAMRLAATRRPEVAGYVLAAPAIWGRASMSVFLRGSLWLASHALPGVVVTDGGPVHVRASDNLATLRRLSRDPLTLHGTRFDTLRGLVDLMDDALAAAPAMPAPTLALYGGRDEVIPPEATATMWRALPPPPGVQRAFYPDGYHLLLRDLGRAAPIADILAWMRDPAAPLPAEEAARDWLAGRA